MQKLIAAIVAAPILFATALSAAAETQSERDARRASYVADFVCHINWQGHSIKMKYNSDGTGDAFYEQGVLYFTWKVAQDKFCLRWENGDDKCSDLPARDIGGEREKFQSMLSKDCV